MSASTPAAVPTVLVVCYGNICRSPMAEALLRARLGSAWHVASAGTHGIFGVPPSAGACAVMLREFGIDISSLHSTPLTVDGLRSADAVFAMSVRQARLAAALLPAAAPRTRLFGGFAPSLSDVGSGDPGGPAVGPHEIPDPMGAGDDAYLRVARRLAAAAERAAAWLLAGANERQAPPPLAAPGWPHTRA